MVEVAVLSGDGIGPEIVAAARRVLDAAIGSIDWVEVDIGEERYRRTGAPAADTLSTLERYPVCLKGPMINDGERLGDDVRIHERGDRRAPGRAAADARALSKWAEVRAVSAPMSPTC